MIFHSNPRTVALLTTAKIAQQPSAMKMPALSCENSEKFGRIAVSRMSGSLLVGPGALNTWMREEARQQQRDRIDHQADDEFVDAEIDAQKARESPPRARPPSNRGDQRQRHMEECRQRHEHSRRSRRKRRPSALPLDADVPEAGAKGDRHRKAGEDQRRRHLQRRPNRLGQPTRPPLISIAIDLEGVLAHRGDQQAADDRRNDDRDRSGEIAGREPVEQAHGGWRVRLGAVSAPGRIVASVDEPRAGRPSSGRLPRALVASASRSATMRPR